MRHLLLISLAICLCYANSNHHNNYLVPPPSYMLDGVTETQIRSYMKFLSDPLLEGRGVGTRGESIAAKYVASLLTTWGIEPAGNDGTYFQSVGMKGTLATEKSSLVFSGPDNGYTTTQNFKDDYCLTTQKLPSSTDTLSFENEEVVFVGYGIVAPDYNWDDYKGVDVAGKIVIMLVNQPNNSVWLNEPMTYYGRWTYKFEEAARHNVKGAILVHTYATASYGWSTIQGSWCNLVTRNTVVPSFPLHLHGWLSESKSNELATKNGKSLTEWFYLASLPTFTPIPLTCTAAVSMKFTLSYFNATNVIGRIRGTLLPNEAVVLSGHIDHLGIRSGVTMPGALDNGSGASITLTLAKVFSTFHSFLTNRFVRSVVFFFPTAEESGLLGSDYFINNLPTPLASTQFVADLNYDIANAWGPAEDISLLGADKSTLGDIFDVACAEEDMYVSPDPLPASGFFFRGDQFTFAKAGVPAVWLYTGSHYVGQPSNYFTDHVQNGYFKNCYHASCDSYSDSIDISGMVQMARVGLRVAYGIAQNPFLTPECNDPCY